MSSRLVKVKRILKKYNQMSIGPLLRVFTILFFWMLCAHWLACGFFWIGWSTCDQYRPINSTVYQKESNASTVYQLDCSLRSAPCGGNWITEYWPVMREGCTGGEAPIVVAEYAGLTLASMHVRALAIRP